MRSLLAFNNLETHLTNQSVVDGVVNAGLQLKRLCHTCSIQGCHKAFPKTQGKVQLIWAELTCKYRRLSNQTDSLSSPAIAALYRTDDLRLWSEIRQFIAPIDWSLTAVSISCWQENWWLFLWFAGDCVMILAWLFYVGILYFECALPFPFHSLWRTSRSVSWALGTVCPFRSDLYTSTISANGSISYVLHCTFLHSHQQIVISRCSSVVATMFVIPE